MLALFPDLLPYVLAIGAALAALWGFGAKQKSKGRKAAVAKAKEADHESAVEIRDNVDRNLNERLHKHDGTGFRDEQ